MQLAIRQTFKENSSWSSNCSKDNYIYYSSKVFQPTPLPENCFDVKTDRCKLSYNSN